MSATSTIRLVTTRSELAAALAPRRTAGERVGFVPTMGALHDGHASLMTRSRTEIGTGPLVVSVFVNPLQFGPGEDLDRYPRTLDADLEVCAAQGVDLVFAPAVDEVYPVSTGSTNEVGVTVDPGPLGDVLEGRTRPGHFAGVLTVVAKLLGMVRPDVAVFGEKDYQQLVLIRRMAADLCLGVDVVGAETVRESDGLALSSRNRFLDAEQRLEAAGLQRTLGAARAAAKHGRAAAETAARAELRKTTGLDLDYLVFTTPDLGGLPSGPAGPDDIAPGTQARALIAARVGRTRLIDNVPLTLGNPG